MDLEYVSKACEVIRAGGLLVYPTESVYGIGCNPNNTTALKKLLNLKKRSPEKGFILVASDFSMFKDFVKPLPKDTLERIKKHWSEPVSWVVPAVDHCPKLLTGNRNTLAIRVSAYPFIQAMCKQLGHAITSTSANISGSDPITQVNGLIAEFANDVDYIVPLSLEKQNSPTPLFDALSGKRLR